MMTFGQLYTDTQDEVQDDSDATLRLIKRAINQGTQKFGAALRREYKVIDRSFSTVGGQRYYQMPEDCIRPSAIVITIGNIDYPLTEIEDDDAWNRLIADDSQNDIPEFFHVKGADLYGIWPTPSTSDGGADDPAGVLSYESRMRRMSAADYTTGTVSVVNESQAIVGAGGAAFTSKMVGRKLIIEDAGDQDGRGYEITTFTDATHLAVENFYDGESASGLSYRIGEVPDFPEEYHESLIDYASWRVYRRRKARAMAKEAKDAFDEAIIQCTADYSSGSSSNYIPPNRFRRPSAGYVHQRRDYTVTGS
jgi:hypothetical protein